jgi:hypothetical protein
VFGNSNFAHTINEYISINNLIKGYHALKNFLFIFDRYVCNNKGGQMRPQLMESANK